MSNQTPEFRFLVALREFCQQAVADTGEQLCNGIPQDYAAYREMVGFHRGLNRILAYAVEENDKMMRL